MEEWKEYKLGNILSVKYGKDHKKIADGNIPIYGSGGIMRYGDRYISEGPSILIPRKGSLNNIMYSDKPFWTVDTMFWTIINHNIANPLFVYYSICKKDFASMNVGSAVPSMTVPVLEDIDIVLPPRKIQDNIVSILKSLDDKIECNKRINDNLEQQAQALFKSWFVDFEPFKDGEFVESELGMIPKNWSVKQLGDVTVQQNEKVKDRTDVKVLSPVTTGELVLSEEYFTKQVYSESVSKYIVVKPKDFAYNPARVNIGSLGMNEFEFDGCVSPVYVVFRCENEYQYYFDLFRHTEFFKEEVKTRAIGGVRQSLGYKDFSLIKVVYPPIDVIHKFNQVYSKILANIKSNKTEIARLASLRDTLLPKLMSGELKVNVLNA
jgi:type I restriction enzyme S subunit